MKCYETKKRYENEKELSQNSYDSIKIINFYQVDFGHFEIKLHTFANYFQT